MDVRDCNGTLLAAGDSVQVIKDLKVKGSSVTLKRGTVIKNIASPTTRTSSSATRTKSRAWCSRPVS